MKTPITLLTSLLVLLNVAEAQFSENFDQNLTALTGNCWVVNQVEHTTTSGDVINGTGSAFTNPPTSGSGERSVATPFLNMNTASLSVSFNYKTSSKISGNATRTINMGITNKNGVFTSLQVLTMDKNSPVTVLNHTATYTIPTGIYRFEIRIGGATGDGNSRMIFDDLNVSASPIYGPVVHCNPGATAVSDSYSIGTISPVSDNVYPNDVFPADGEVYTTVLVSAPSQGVLVLSGDGTFTYTPDPLFTGGTVVFTYQVVDDGYTPVTSNTATVSINYPMPVLLPVKLIDFEAEASGSEVEISWVAENNNKGDYFEIEKSLDGKSFVSINQVSISANSPVKKYESSDKYSGNEIYYRLKIVNKDQSVSYSKVVMVKGTEDQNELHVIGTSVQSTLNVVYKSGSKGIAVVTIYAINGAKLLNSTHSLNTRMNSINVQVNHLNTGSYVVVLTSGTDRSVARFVKL